MNPALTGVPVYPGAYRTKDGGANIEWSSKDGGSDKNLYVIGGERRRQIHAARIQGSARAAGHGAGHRRNHPFSRVRRRHFRVSSKAHGPRRAAPND
jgi:hypothetical protein